MNGYSDVLAAANLPLTLLLIVMLMIIGIGVTLGQTTADGVLNRLIRMSIVVMFIAESSVYFQYVQQFFLSGLPNFFTIHIISLYTGQYGASQSSPGAGFDAALNLILKDVSIIQKSIPQGVGGIDSIVPGIELMLAEAIAIMALAFLFGVFIVVQVLLGVVIIVGPLMVLGYLFDYTKRITDGWISALITLSILSLVVDVVVLVLVAAVQTIFSNIVMTGSFEQNLEAFLGGAVGILVIALAVAVLPRVIEGIGGGVALGLGLENSSRWLRGSPLFMPGSRGSRSIGGGSSTGGGADRPSTSSRIVNRIRNRNKGNS
ncbi:type IV secretion system protein [Acidiphilium acidophilum]|uniref:type IV secretion system protein n=1 Tax=Acidiphilium acidophilum TaxID=76588 RepID=UPI002E8E788D|nr:type IV secretion system protein [Acidiphilium acidophilum]